MTQVLRLARPAAGSLAAGFLVPLLLFSRQPALVQESLPTATSPGAAVPHTVTPAQRSVPPSSTPLPVAEDTAVPIITETAAPTPEGTVAPTETAQSLEVTVTSPPSRTATPDSIEASVTASPSPTEIVESAETTSTASPQPIEITEIIEATATALPSPTGTVALIEATTTISPSPTETAVSIEVTATPSPSATETPEAFEATVTASPSPTQTATATPTSTATVLARSPHFDLMAVLINEVAWSGTEASSHDEWIELHNPGATPIDLGGWILSDGGDLNIHLTGSIPAYGFFLLERTDETTVLSHHADQIYTGALSNDGESLELLDPSGAMVDTANADGGGWPAGSVVDHASMERLGGPDGPGAWRTFTGCWSTGTDADGNPLSGTPLSPNSSDCPEATQTDTLTPTSSPSPTATASPTNAPTPAEALSVLINEVAWSGTEASPQDEWIELHNPGAAPIGLGGWILSDGGDVNIHLRGSVPAYGFFLFERTDDTSIRDIPADQIYTGGLNNSGESLWLLDPAGTIIDSANADGGAWPAGDEAAHRSMERRGGDDHPGNWGTFPGFGGVGRDAQGNAIAGTPRQPNAVNLPRPKATGIPSRVVINEVLIRPHYDWEGAGGVSPDDEFIELYNAGDLPVHLLGWILDDVEGAGSRPYTIQDCVLPAHSFLAIFRSRTHIALNDGGDTVRLIEPGGRVMDRISYRKVRASNLSYGRLPDGGHHLRYGLWPTAGESNELFVEPVLPLPIVDTFACPAGHLHPLLSQLPNHPLARLHASTALLVCP